VAPIVFPLPLYIGIGQTKGKQANAYDLLKNFLGERAILSKEGVKGVTQCNDRMQHLVSLLKGLVIPYFMNEEHAPFPVSWITRTV
jgi:hypothetical protein